MTQKRAGGANASAQRHPTLTGLALAALALALFLPALANDFVNWDDVDYVTGNPNLGRFDFDFVRWSFTSWWHLNWHPLTWISYGLDHAIWGVNPLGYHLMNVLLHAANTYLVFRLASRLLACTERSPAARQVGAVVAGALFAVHPLHVESVAWVSERKDVLYACFTLLAVLRYLDYTHAVSTRARQHAYCWALALFALSAMAKPMAVTLPAVLLILDAYPLGRLRTATDRLRVVVVEKLPFFAISLIVTALTIAAQQAGGALKVGDLTLFERSLVAGRALGFYLAKFIAPVPLVPLYPLPDTVAPFQPDILLSLSAVIAITAIALVWRTRRPVVAACWAYYLVTLLPVIGLVQVGAQAAADRYTYLPILGPIFIVAAIATSAWDARPALRRALVVVAALATLGLAARTVVQIGVWRDSFALWQHVLEHYPDAVPARYNLGYAYLTASDFANAEQWFRRTIEVQPNYTPALNELGGLASKRHAYDEAIAYYRVAIESSPQYPNPHFNIAQIYELRNDYPAAKRHYEAFVRLATPDQADVVATVRAKLAGW